MASSDDEGEPVVNNVSDYEFTYGSDDEPISFAMLPVEWSQGKAHDGEQRKIYLKGKTDNGCRKIYVQVTAWKYDFPKAKPEISVLSVHGNWIKLLKPWNPFYKIIRTVLVTLHVLHSAKWDSQLSEKALWNNLNTTFSLFERRPCADDLEEHVPLITEAMKRDVRLAKSKILSELLEKKPWEKKTLKEDVKPSFIVDDVIEKEDGGETDKTNENEDNESEEGGDSDSEEGDCFDSVCAICDNGGALMICDGKCLRSFHATVKDGEDSKCESLDLTDAEQEAIKNVPFICENCKYKKHQCFACGKLGSSDELSNPEVFCCVNGACGYFYHPRCVAKLLHPGDNAAAEKLHKRISAGEPFACPIHKCHVCKELEGRSEPDTQFAVCRRCPKAYHRKCLPREIAFEDSNEDSDTEHIQRAWEGLIPKRILIYCLDHEIEEELFTPPRNHIIFPGPRQAKKKKLELESCRKKNLLKERSISLKNNAGNKISVRQQNTNDTKGGDLSRKRLQELPTRLSSKNQKLAATRNTSVKLKKSANDDTGVSSNDDGFYGTNYAPVISRSMATGHCNNEIIKKAKSTAKKTDDSVTLDADAKRRLLTLMEVASSSITIEDIKKQHKPPSTHVPYSRLSVENVTHGKVKGAIQAVNAALKKLDVDGGSIQDAKAVCGDDLLEQVFRWKEKLKVYLAPFLHGMRYTSFGRHFTKLDKLKEIVDILHWYVQDGDMLVDFCCGSNDFSCLMKKKLDEMGRLCSFKNYDILQAKNDFNFERRDWMGVKKDELPDGSQLIMGLNPPFGVNASLANKFINKALEFKPKLLVLIVPRETQRLDEKESPYDLIWEDDQMLAGKSFYLPGSVDVNDKQIEDWNKNAPVLYLWSRPDCTPKHRAVAEQHSHLSGALKSYRLDESHNEPPTPNLAQAIDHKISIGGENKHADTPKTLEQMGKNTISHREDLLADAPKNLEQMGKKDTISHREDMRAHTPKNLENTGKETISHWEDLLADAPKNLEQMGKKDTISHREDMRAHTPKNLEHTGKETVSHRKDFPRGTEAGKNHTAVKNHSGSGSKSFGGKGNQKRPASDMFLNNKSRSNLSESRHRQTNHLESYPSEHLGTPSQVYSERGNNQQQQRNESNLPTYRKQAYAQTGYNGNGVNEFQHLTQQQHENDRIVDEHLLMKYTGPAEEPRRSVSSRQAYDQSPRLGMSGMQAYDQSPRHGMSGMQAYDQSPRHGMSGMQAYDQSPRHGMQAYGRSPNTEYAFDASSDQQRLAEIYQNAHGRRVLQQQQPDHWNPLGSAIPPPPPPPPPHLHHLHRYPHQLNTVGTSTPVTHRYASRLDEAQHGMMMFPEREEEVRREYHLGRPQLPSQFAPGPYYPRYPTSSGWIQD